MAEKAQTSFVVTANRLSDGTVLYLGASSRWVEKLDLALVTRDATERDRLLAFAKQCESEICGPYALEMLEKPDGTRVLSARERLRALGPADVRRRLGY
jgi:hypothetical protein